MKKVANAIEVIDIIGLSVAIVTLIVTVVKIRIKKKPGEPER